MRDKMLIPIQLDLVQEKEDLEEKDPDLKNHRKWGKIHPVSNMKTFLGTIPSGVSFPFVNCDFELETSIRTYHLRT